MVLAHAFAFEAPPTSDTDRACKRGFLLTDLHMDHSLTDMHIDSAVKLFDFQFEI